MDTTTLFSWRMILGLGMLMQLAMIVPGYRAGTDGFLYGDSHFYAAITESIVRDGDMNLLNQCFPGAGSVQEVLPTLEGPYSGEFGWAKAEYLTIKQSPLMSLVAIPFYVVFGEIGFLMLNLVMLNITIVATAKLAGDGPAARAFALLGILTTPLIRFTYNFSPDIFLCALMLGALWAAQSGRGLLAGVLAGLAVSSKLYVIVLLLPVPFWLLLVCSRRVQKFLLCLLGGAIGLTPGLVLNTVLFGAPHITGYERQLLVENGSIGLADHSSRFTDPILLGLQDLLFNPQVGVVWQAPLWCLWPVAFARAWRAGASRPALVSLAGVILLSFALFAPYNGRDSGSTVGNRYLFPAILAGYALLGLAAECIVSRSFVKNAEPRTE
jgi:Glycosyltransferase family 87